MNLLKKAEQIAGLLKQAADLEAVAKKKKEEEAPKDLDLDAIPVPDLASKGLDDLATPAVEPTTPEVGGDSADIINSIKENLINGSLIIDAVSTVGDQIKTKYTDKKQFDVFVQQLLDVLKADPKIKSLANWSEEAMRDSLEALAPSAKKDTPESTEPVVDPLADAPVPATDEQLSEGSDSLAGSDVPTTEDNPAMDLGSTLEGEDPARTPKDSLFAYLTKSAFDMNTLAGDAVAAEQPVLEVTGLSDDERESAFNWAASVTEQMTPEEKGVKYCQENGLPETEAPKFVEYFKTITTNAAVSNLMEKQAALDAFLKDIAEYKADTYAEDAIIEAAKTASSADEFLSKVATQESLFKKANTIDEPSASPQHPGKKMFNGDTVSFTNGKQQYWPGQKVMQTRDGGNAEVVSVFNFKGTPDVDVYTNKPARKNVTSINTPNGGTIAFFQPIKEEPVEISKPVDTTGIVTGEIQKNPGVKEQLAGAGHETNNYLDQVFKLADKPKVAGPLPTAKAGFSFNGLTKTAEANSLFADNNPSTTSGTSALGTDAGCGPNANKLQEDRPKSLTQEQVVEAQQTFKDKEGQLVASAADKETPEATPAAAPSDKPEKPSEDKDQLNDPNTVDPMEYEKVKLAVEALPQDKLAQVKEVADNVNLLKQKLEEVIVMTNPGEQLPTLNDEGYKRLAKEVFQVELDPKKINAPAPAKTSNEGKKAEPEAEGLGATDKPAGDKKDLFAELGL